MALITKVLILAICAIAVECTFPVMNPGMMGHNMMGMRPPWMNMMGMGGMYPGMGMGMMGFNEEAEKSSDRPDMGSSNVAPELESRTPGYSTAKEITQAFADAAEQMRQQNPVQIPPTEQAQEEDH